MGLFINMNNKFGKNNFPASNEVLNNWEWIAYWRGLLNGSDEYVRNEAIKRNMGGNSKESYIAQPIPYTISRASSNLLFSESPDVKLANDNDNENLERIIRENKLWTQCRAAALTCSALGGVYCKVTVDPSTPRGRRTPLIQFIDPDLVQPEFSSSSELIKADIVIEEWEEGNSGRIYRLVESNEINIISLSLYAGTSNAIGNKVPLGSHEKTRDLKEVKTNNLDELAVVYIANSLNTGNHFGVSDYAHGVDNLFYAFNDATTIAHKATQAGVPYTVIPKEFADENNNLSHEKTIITVNKLSDTLGDGDFSKMIETIQHNAQQDKFMAYANEILDQILMSVGLSPQSVGRSVDGGATSGTALKLKMITSLQTAAGKAAYFEDGLNYILRIAAKLDAEEYGYDNFIKKAENWEDSEAAVSVKLKDGLPDDEIANASIVQTLKAAGVISMKEAIKKVNPTFTDDQVNQEMKEIQEEADAETVSIANALPSSPGLSLANALQLDDTELQ